jgi:hypothetical protein
MTTIPLPTAQQLQQVAKEHNYTLPESEYSFIYMYIGEKQEIEPKLCVTKEVEERYKACLIPAYTIEELFKPLNTKFSTEENNKVFHLTVQSNGNEWFIFYCRYGKFEIYNDVVFKDKSLTEALAQLLIYLIK